MREKVMSKTVRAIFDGEVLRPETPVDLEANVWYVLTIEPQDKATKLPEETYPLTGLLDIATDMGVTDLSIRHREYAHGHLEDDARES